jgi:hypothetical protein
MTLLLLFRFASLAALFAFVTLIGLRSSRRNAVPWTTTDEGQGARKLATATRRWLDPKTVVLKNSGQDTNLASMRIVAFGTSKTWGAGLEDPNDVRAVIHWCGYERRKISSPHLIFFVRLKYQHIGTAI